jgi:chorismate synthase
VAAGAVAKKLLAIHSIEVCAYLQSICDIATNIKYTNIKELQIATHNSPIFCPDTDISTQMIRRIEQVNLDNDSLGGIVKFVTSSLPIGLGEPIYEKLEANLAKGMLSIPATKGFEIGEGFNASKMLGSEHNDEFIKDGNVTKIKTNNSGGTLGGISNGMPLYGKVAFKPTSSIKMAQETVDINGQPASLILPTGSRHDPCIAIRAVPVVEAMCALVLADAILMNQCRR